MQPANQLVSAVSEPHSSGHKKYDALETSKLSRKTQCFRPRNEKNLPREVRKYKINVFFFLMQIRVNASETSETICSLFFDEKEEINRDFSGQNKDHPSRLQFQADYCNNYDSDSFDWHLEKRC